MKSTIVSNHDVNHIVGELQKLKKQMSALKAIEERLKQDLYNYMGEHDVMINCETGEEFVNWSYSEGYMKFDSKKFMEDKPKIYKQYLFKTEPVRTLRLAK